MRRLLIMLVLIVGMGPAVYGQAAGPRIPAYWSVEGFINSQYSYVPGETNTFFIRHARVDLKGFVSDKLEFRLQSEFAGNVKMLDAAIKCKFHKSFNIQVGQFKTPFTLESQYHLLKKEGIDYAQVINRLSGYSDPLPGNRNNGRDVGIMVYGGLFEVGEKPFSLISYNIGVFNGTGINRKDDNLKKDIIARIDIRPFVKDLVLSASVIAGSYNDGTEADVSNNRWSLGMEYKDDAMTVRSEYVRADIGGLGTIDGYYAVAGYWFDLPMSQRIRPIIRYDTFNYAGAVTTLCMAGFDWWPWSHLRLQTGYTRDLSSDKNIFQVMASVKY